MKKTTSGPSSKADTGEHADLSAKESLRQHISPARRRGGQELPVELQDRPEQNAGYDAAVRGDGTAEDVNWDGDSGEKALETSKDGRERSRPDSD
jgi:hypothetical protein